MKVKRLFQKCWVSGHRWDYPNRKCKKCPARRRFGARYV